MEWRDYPGGSTRSDGARISEFYINGRIQLWGYPATWTFGCKDDLSIPVGPFFSYKHAKQEMDYPKLPLGENQHA